jgi:rhamnogalacturonyl hydrolase YesR
MDQQINNMLFRTKESLEHSLKPRFEFKPKNIAIEFVKAICKQPLNRKYKFFFWPTASLALALELGFSNAHNDDLLDTLMLYYRHWARKGSRIYFLDQIMNGYPLLFLFNNKEDQMIKELLDKMYEYIKNYPRGSTGSLPYRKNNPETVLVDYLGMVCPFLSRYGKTFNCKDSSNLSATLLKDYLLNGMDSKMGLPYHGFRSDIHERIGIIGWGRGVGWLLIGMIDTLAFLDKSNDNFNFLLDNYRILLNSVIKFQDSEGYFKWMLSAEEGHVDSSATSMIGYSIKRGINLHLLDSEYTFYAEKSLHALLNSTKNGLVFDSSAECQGIGVYPQQYEWNLWGQGFGTAFALSMLM